jgi:hypothetical protein
MMNQADHRAAGSVGLSRHDDGEGSAERREPPEGLGVGRDDVLDVVADLRRIVVRQPWRPRS